MHNRTTDSFPWATVLLVLNCHCQPPNESANLLRTLSYILLQMGRGLRQLSTAGSITLEADDDLNGAGTVNVLNGDILSTNGGAIALRGERVTVGEDMDSNGGNITFAANRNADGAGIFDFAYGKQLDIVSDGGDIDITGAELYLRTNTFGTTIQGGAGDVSITDNGGNGTYDVYMTRGTAISGNNIDVTSAGDITMSNTGTNFNATGNLTMTTVGNLQMNADTSATSGGNTYANIGTTANVRDMTAGGNLGVVAGGDINVYNNGLTANGSTGWNGAADETMVVWSTGGSIAGSGFNSNGLGNVSATLLHCI